MTSVRTLPVKDLQTAKDRSLTNAYLMIVLPYKSIAYCKTTGVEMTSRNELGKNYIIK